MTNQQQTEHYLGAFRAHLTSITPAQREDIMREIAGHIRDSAEEPGSDLSSILARLGTPETLARQYRDALLFRHATRSLSPPLLVRAALRLATKGAFGILVAFCGLFGYLIAFGLAAVALVKPLSPSHTGLWMQGGHVVTSGALVTIPASPAQEVLGWWVIPVALLLAALLATATTLLIRLCLGLSERWLTRLESPVSASRFNAAF